MARIPSGMRKKPNGLYEKRFTVDGKRYSVYGNSIKECQDKEFSKREQLKAGLKDNRNINLDTYFNEWEEERKGTVKQSTIEMNRTRYDLYISPALGKKKLKDIEKRDITVLQKELAKKLSPSSINLVITTLKNVLNSAVDDEIIIKNPTTRVAPLKTDNQKKASETIHRALTKNEQRIFIQEARNEWLFELFSFALCTGMRLGEIAALTWGDIDYTNNVIHVNKSRSFKKGGGVDITTPKTKKSVRDIPMNDTIRGILESQRTKIKYVYGEPYVQNTTNNIFIGANGCEYIASATVTYSIKAILKRLDEKGIHIERFTSHAFRDTFATRYIEAGGNMQTLKTILGHTSLQMTMDLYAHVLPDTKQEEMKMIENAFAGVIA